MQVENQFGKIKSVSEAMEYIKDGMTLLVGGFGGVGSSPLLIDAIVKKNVKDLTIVTCDGGDPNVGPDRLIVAGLAKKEITSHIGATPLQGQALNEGRLEVEFSPQGTLVERIRAGGAGIGGFLTDVGMGTIMEEGKQKIVSDGKTYLLEKALRGDVAIIYAKKADSFGNLVYDKSARNYNPIMATAADVTIVHAEEIVPLGSLDPEAIVTPGVFVNIIVTGKGGEWKWFWE